MILRSLLTLVLLTAAAFSADDPAKAVERAEKDWATGLVKNDFALLEKVLAGNLSYTHSNGIFDTKATYIERLKSGQYRYTQMQHENLKVTVLTKDVAITTARAKVIALVDGKQTPMTLSLLHVFQLAGGQWQMVAHQSAKLQ